MPLLSKDQPLHIPAVASGRFESPPHLIRLGVDVSKQNDHWPPPAMTQADLESADAKTLLDYYTYEKTHAYENEKWIYETTKYNFLAFGAVFLLTNASFLSSSLDARTLIVGACFVVGIISVSASILVLFLVKYVSASGRKYRVIEKALWRKRPLSYIEWKYKKEHVVDAYTSASRIGLGEFIKSNYVFKWINLLPLFCALALGTLVGIGFIPIRSITGGASINSK